MLSPRHSSSIVCEALNIPDPADQPHPEEGAIECPQPGRFGFMFPRLQADETKLLPTGPETIRALVMLGKTMIDKEPLNRKFDSSIPSIYTYFGQFIVHDLTFDPKTLGRLYEEDVESLQPFSVEEINALPNPRTGLMDLDSVYGPILDNNQCHPVPLVGDEMKLEVAVNSRTAGTDLPRLETPPYKARIGDHRNDENLVISQLHLAFLRAHNVLVKAGASFDQARTFLRRRYQQLVRDDFLPTIVDAEDIEWAKDEKNRIFDPSPDGYFMPVEFSVAAFRFGHAMIRSKYQYNSIRKLVRLDELLTAKALSSYHHILAEWIIDWKDFLRNGQNRARNFAPRLIEPLADFVSNNFAAAPANAQPAKRLILSLAVIDLIRGYLFRLPTGQAVAEELGVKPMSPETIEEVAARVSEEQRKVLSETGLSRQTPLWYYILAESDHLRTGNGLGPVGGRLVASVLVESARRSCDSAFKEDGWDPILGQQEGFGLGEFLRRVSVNDSASWR